MNLETTKRLNIVVNHISQFCGAVADKDVDGIKKYYQMLKQENVNVAIMTSIHDIYVSSLQNQWNVAQSDALLIVNESANRFKEHYGLLTHGSSADTKRDENDFKKYSGISKDDLSHETAND